MKVSMPFGANTSRLSPAMVLSNSHKLQLNRHAQRQLVAPITTLTPNGARTPFSPGAAIVPHASSGRTTGPANASQRSFSVMQSAMKIPGLASALHLIGVNGPGITGSTAAGDSTVAAAGSGASPGASPPAPEENLSMAPAAAPEAQQQLHHQHQQQHQHHQQQLEKMTGGTASSGEQVPAAESAAAAAAAAADAADAAAAAAEMVYELAAVAAASNNGNSNGQLPHAPPHSTVANGMVGVRHVNGHAGGGGVIVGQLRGCGDGGVGASSDGPDPLLSIFDVPPPPPSSSSRTENNILSYTGSQLPSLAVQIRDIASTLRHINSLRGEYLDKIAAQELELSAKDQVLRSREERIQSLEQEAAELRRSLTRLQTAKAAAEAEVQRLRAAAATAAAAVSAPPPPLRAVGAPEAQPALSPPPAVATVPAATPEPAATAAPAAPPHPLTSPPAAMVSSGPVAAPALAHPPEAAPAAPAPAPAPAPPPAPPPSPPPPRVPEIVLSYRSSWPEAYLHVNVEGRGWTAVPGLRMEHGGAKEHVVRLPARSAEFVLTNGLGEWDSPGGPGRNYRIDSPGEYRLHYGALAQVKPWSP